MGTFNGPGAVLAPAAGGGMGPFTISESITFNADSSFSYSFKAKPGRSKTDTLIAKGVTIKNGATIQLKGKIQGTLEAGTVLPVITNTSSQPISGSFTNLAEGAIVTINGNNLQAAYHGGSGNNDLILTVMP